MSFPGSCDSKNSICAITKLAETSLTSSPKKTIWEITGVWCAYPMTELLVAVVAAILYKNKTFKYISTYTLAFFLSTSRKQYGHVFGVKRFNFLLKRDSKETQKKWYGIYLKSLKKASKYNLISLVQ